MRFINQTQKGFTLIELLVVISIIGVLATIILGALGDARARSIDARIHAQLNSLRTEAEFFYLDNDSYHGPRVNGFFDNDVNNCALNQSIGSRAGSILANGTTVNLIIDQAVSLTGSPRVFCAFGNSQNDSWAVAVPLLDPPTGMTGLCADSTGEIGYIDFNFYGAPGYYPLGGGGTMATCGF